MNDDEKGGFVFYLCIAALLISSCVASISLIYALILIHGG